MDADDIHDHLDDLTTSIDTLTSTLQPLLSTPLSTTTSKLPLLDKAKLYVLATYALESLLFSSLRLSGVDAKAHPVFEELARVKGYFGKIKKAEEGGRDSSGRARVDKEAVGRFVRAGLAGNERADRGEKRKAEATVGTHTRFDGSAKRIRRLETGGSGDGNGSQKVQKHTKFDEDGDGGEVHVGSKERKKKSSKPPKSSGEALQSLLGSDSTDQSKRGKRGKKSKGQKLEDERADEMK